MRRCGLGGGVVWGGGVGRRWGLGRWSVEEVGSGEEVVWWEVRCLRLLYRVCMAVDNFQCLGGLNDWGLVREGACPLLQPERGFGGAL